MANKSRITSANAILVKLGLKTAGEDARKTISFGDPAAAKGGLIWSIVSVAAIGALWQIAAIFEWTNQIFFPSPAATWNAFLHLLTEGYRNTPSWEHVGVSVYRLMAGFLLGCALGIPIGFAMGLSRFWNGIFSPIVEFMRPIPPLALIPLAIIWFGIGDKSKIWLLFLAALWVMVLSARAGVQNIRLSKIHAAYTLGASKTQVLQRVILPNALPEIFTGMRVAMGVCWGTLVAAELVGADSGIGYMITVAGKFLDTPLVFIGIIIIGIIGGAFIDVGMRRLETKLVPWKGKG